MSNQKRKTKKEHIPKKGHSSNCFYVKPSEFINIVNEFLTPGTQKYEDLMFLAEKHNVYKEVLTLTQKLKKKAKQKKLTKEDIVEINEIMGELDEIFIDADLPDNY